MHHRGEQRSLVAKGTKTPQSKPKHSCSINRSIRAENEKKILTASDRRQKGAAVKSRGHTESLERKTQSPSWFTHINQTKGTSSHPDAPGGDRGGVPRTSAEQAGSPCAWEGKHKPLVLIKQQGTLAGEGNGKTIRNCICLSLTQLKQTWFHAFFSFSFRSGFPKKLGGAV